MATQEQYQPLSVNTGSAQGAIQATPNVTPGLENLMQNVASGFLSVDDIRRRASDGPLEAATRNSALADIQQIRPLQRAAQTAELENVRAKQQFEAESLPVLNDVKREQLKQEYQNVLQHGVPAATLKLFNQVVPGFMPYDKAKLFPKDGGVDISYAAEILGKAFEKADKLKQASSLKPVSIKDVSETGEERTYEQLIHPVTGQPLGAKIPTGVKEVNVTELDAKQKAAQASLSNDFLAERNRSDALKRFGPQISAFDAIGAIRNRGTPIKNADDLAILYEFIKILDPTSVVREGEKKFAESTAPGVQQLYNKVQGLWSDSNRTMDAETRNNLFATVDTLETAAKGTVIPELKRLSNLAIDRGVPLSQALTEPEIKLLVNGPSGKAAVSAAPTATGSTSVPFVDFGNIPEAEMQAKAAALPASTPGFIWNGRRFPRQ